MGTLTKLRQAVFDVANGIYSGIPLCCVAYYTAFSWRWPHLPCGRTASERRTGTWPDADSVNYVRCDRCYKRGRSSPLKLNGAVLKWLRPV